MGGIRTVMILGVLALAGCPHFYKLDPKDVSALDVGGDKQTMLCARGGLVDVLAVTKDGKKHAEGQKEQIKEDEFNPELVKLEASVGGFHDRSWNPPDDPLALLKVQSVTVTAVLVANTRIRATKELKPTWACEQAVAYANGADGVGGAGGVSGDEGREGAEGERGGNGDHGYNATVTIGYVDHAGEKLAIADFVVEGGNEQVYVIDPTAPLIVQAGGGAGGQGGQGGFGGSSTTGRGGRGGRGGDGGDGADGGYVLVRYDASTPDLLNLVQINVKGGAAGPGGAGGSGGASGGSMSSADDGPLGRDGREGRDGRFETQAVNGINAQLSAYALSGERPPAPEPVRPPAHGKKDPHALVGPPQRPAPSRPPPTHETTDGARYYEGRAKLTMTVPRQPASTQTSNVQIESTRTRKHHFTIKMGDCALQFHRPPGEQQHKYDLDAPTQCIDSTVKVKVTSARLVLDSEHNGLTMTWEGTAVLAKPNPQIKGPISVSFSFNGVWR